MKFARTGKLPTGRPLTCILGPKWAKSWSRQLKWRIDAVLDPMVCADWAWFRDHRGEYWTGTRTLVHPIFRRGLHRAYDWLPPAWVYMDIVGFYPNVTPQRLWRVVNRLSYATDPTLPKALRAHFKRIDYDLEGGLPSGNAVACGLANAFLYDIDKRFNGDILRYGDNIAVRPLRAAELRKQLLDIGLHTSRRSTFTKRKTVIKISSPATRCPLGRRSRAWVSAQEGRRRQQRYQRWPRLSYSY